jgi:hypothetical protein
MDAEHLTVSLSVAAHHEMPSHKGRISTMASIVDVAVQQIGGTADSPGPAAGGF